MKAAKYLFALWAGVLIYTSLSVLFGSAGLSAYRQLEMEQKKHEANIENLKQINTELENSMNSLLYDKDTMTMYARQQGYASSRERFIRVVGLGIGQKPSTAVGQVFAVSEPVHASDKALKITAFCAAIGVFLCIAVLDFLKFLRQRG